MGSYGGGGYLSDDCSECDFCGQPMLGSGACRACFNEIKIIYPRLGLDENGKDENGRDRSGLAWGYLKLHGYYASSVAKR